MYYNNIRKRENKMITAKDAKKRSEILIQTPRFTMLTKAEQKSIAPFDDLCKKTIKEFDEILKTGDLKNRQLARSILTMYIGMTGIENACRENLYAAYIPIIDNYTQVEAISNYFQKLGYEIAIGNVPSREFTTLIVKWENA